MLGFVRLGDFVKKKASLHVENSSSPPPPTISSSETAGPASAVLLEGAGGVLSPGPSGTPQADLFRALRLPCLLVGDGRLGGISATAAAREALLLRGYSVPVCSLYRQDVHIKGAGEGEGEGGRCRVVGLPPLPPPEVPLGRWYAAAAPGLAAAADAMAEAHRARLASLARARDEAAGGVWWPFTQHRGRAPGQTLLVDSALGDDLQVVEPGPEDVTFEKVFDGCASWWTQVRCRVGQGGALVLAGARVGRYGHVIFRGADARRRPRPGRAAGARPRLGRPRVLQRQRVDGGGGRAQDGLPQVPAAPVPTRRRGGGRRAPGWWRWPSWTRTTGHAGVHGPLGALGVQPGSATLVRSPESVSSSTHPGLERWPVHSAPLPPPPGGGGRGGGHGGGEEGVRLRGGGLRPRGAPAGGRAGGHVPRLRGRRHRPVRAGGRRRGAAAAAAGRLRAGAGAPGRGGHEAGGPAVPARAGGGMPIAAHPGGIR
ncbi:unnamed protein product [Heterosigma akashiwo]